mmetsp:Transcript_11687/g.19502  ORF Transcript_11687/g.19502 Transcript_11687/m.19502 type:complete len:96 (+) Transcript_11687:67-354(+)
MTDPTKQEFQDYLERSGVIDTLTQALVDLYEDPSARNSDGVHALKNKLKIVGEQTNELELLRKENAVLKKDLTKYRSQIQELNAKIEKLEKSSQK